MKGKLQRFPPDLHGVSGIYIHIPFCRTACHYCDFHFSTSLGRKADMVAALERELQERQPKAPDATTLYFGGGTPSVLDEAECARLVKAAEGWRTPGQPWAELTLEANPEDVTPEKCAAWRAAGITRLSIGVQTFDDRLLGWMNRKHSGAQARAAIEQAAAAGFPHLTADLIYGLPGRAAADWAADLDQIQALPLDHFSAYILTVEPRTVLGHRVAKGQQIEATDSAVETAYQLLCERAAAGGFEHYEISNFARPGGHAVHNSRYWQGVPYAGIGPGAHSFDGAFTRRFNVPHNLRYLTERPFETENLTPADRYNESLMTGFRTADGISLADLGSAFGARPDRVEPAVWASRVADGTLEQTETGNWRIAESQWLLSDAVSSDFFIVD